MRRPRQRKRKPTPPNKTTTTQRSPHPAVQHWVRPPDARECTSLTEAQRRVMTDRIRADLMAPAVPLRPRQPRVLLLVTGVPGAGKSTVARTIARNWYGDGEEHFLNLDYDDALNYHPLGPGLWQLRDAVTGGAVPIGSTERFWQCLGAAANVMAELVHGELLQQTEYSLVLHRHAAFAPALQAAARLGWRTALAYVAVPLAVAQDRARRRAPTNGRFLSPESLAETHAFLREVIPSLVWMADEFVLVDNSRENEPPRIDRREVRTLIPGSAETRQGVRAVEAMIDTALGVAVRPRPAAAAADRDRRVLAGLALTPP